MERERPSRARSAFVLTTCDLFWRINDASLRDNYCYCVPGSAKVVISGMLLLTVQFFQMGLNGVYSRGTISEAGGQTRRRRIFVIIRPNENVFPNWTGGEREYTIYLAALVS